MKWPLCCRACVSPVRARRPVGDTTLLVAKTKGEKDEEGRMNLDFCIPPHYSSPSAALKFKCETVECLVMDDSVYHKTRSLSMVSTSSDSSILSKGAVSVHVPAKQSWSAPVNGRRPFPAIDCAPKQILEEKPDVEESELCDKVSPLQSATADSSDLLLGFLAFRTAYEENQQRLTVHVEKAEELPRKGHRETYDTILRLGLVPSKKSWQKSRRVKDSLSPPFREDFEFFLDAEKQKEAKYLKISLFDYDRQGQHDAIGHVILTMSEAKNGRAKFHYLPLRPMSLPVSGLGEVLLSLCYIPSQARLSIRVVRGRNLRQDPFTIKNSAGKSLIKSSFDTYAKVTLMCGGEKVKSKRTQIIPDCRNPVYDRSFHYIVPPTFLDDSSVLVTLLVRGPLQQSSVLGRVVSGPYTVTSKRCLTHWGQMVQQRRVIMRWRTLCL